MEQLKAIYTAISQDGFAERTLKLIKKYISDIQDGTENFYRFNLTEHAGLCTAGAPLIGASIVACYARASFTTGSDAESSQGAGPANWQIDERSGLGQGHIARLEAGKYGATIDVLSSIAGAMDSKVEIVGNNQ